MFSLKVIIVYHKIIVYLNIGSSNDLPKLSTQTQASQMQQMQSAAVQLLAQGALSRHTALRSQPVQSTWSNPSLKQHPGLSLFKFFYYELSIFI